MVRQRVVLLRAALVACDYIAVVAAFVLASVLRWGPDLWRAVWADLLPRPAVVVAVYGIGVVGLLAAAGLYRPRVRWSVRTEVGDLLRTAALLVGLTVGLLFFFKLEDVSRWFLALYFPLVVLGMSASRVAAHRVFRWARQRGRAIRHLLLVGAGPRGEQFAAWCADHPELGIRVAGYLDDHAAGLDGHDLLGRFDDLPRVLAEQVIDEVAICLPLTEWATIDWLAEVSEEQGKVVRIPMDALNRAVAKGRLEDLGDGPPILSLVSSPDHALALAVKRGFDILGAAVLLVVSAPVLVAAALAILLTDGRPLLYRQVRGGLHGRPFTLWKLRTMVRDADEQKGSLAARNERSGPAFKVRCDPRIMPVGRWLRRTSLDELPQLWNVLAGHMSLVGPRPADMAEVRTYDRHHRRRLSVRPGLTGLWQVTARRDPDFERWLELDLAYIDSWSLWRDLRLLCRTPVALIRSPGE